jgi:hypothetical protein
MHIAQIIRTEEVTGNVLPVTLTHMVMRGLKERQAKRARNRAWPQKIDPLEIRVIRERTEVVQEVQCGYDQLVSGAVDRNEWAKVVSELLDTIPRRNKTTFAARVGINPRTVTYWLDQQTDVKESSVRAVAEAFGINAMQLLIRVGVYSIEQMVANPVAEADDELSMVLAADVDDVTKQMMIERLYELREQDKQRRLEHLRWTIQQNQRRSA